MREETVKGAESPRCVGNLTPSFFLLFIYSSVRLSLSFSLFIGRAALRIFLSPALRRRRLTLERGRPSPPFDYPQETSTISRRLSLDGEKGTHVVVVVSNTRKGIHGFSAKPGIRDILYVAFMLDSLDEREAIVLTNSEIKSFNRT